MNQGLEAEHPKCPSAKKTDAERIRRQTCGDRTFFLATISRSLFMCCELSKIRTEKMGDRIYRHTAVDNPKWLGKSH
ncbi:hypothetical protein NDN08_008175 [Rhodosorus marinus]|uniref:Uncharacterized protein n=1 Tax=Rhodosorus marinus TaxID=101924 RepID=A0AAV8V0S5_9RHOD|nr:hypothetical protein NDN08_008175 [Rhodosorus marinus]